jgi:small subunit ribosomal protein S6
MQMYELMLILTPQTAIDDEKKQETLVKKLLNDQEITNLELEVWGKRTLAYEIKKQTEGIYLIATFEGKQIQVGKLEQQIKLQTDVIRYLLTKKEAKK